MPCGEVIANRCFTKRPARCWRSQQADLLPRCWKLNQKAGENPKTAAHATRTAISLLENKHSLQDADGYYSTIVTVISTRSLGLSRSSRATLTILSATPIPLVTSPNTEYLRSKNRESSTTTKN